MRKDDVVIAVEKDGNVHEISISHKSSSIFETLHGKGSVERIIVLLASECNSFADVGRILNMSRQSVQQWFNAHLSRHFQDHNGMARKRACTLVSARRKHFPLYVRRLWHDARKHGISVAQVNKINASGLVSRMATVIFLGDVLTSVYYLENRHSLSGGHVFYATTMITRKGVQRFPLHCFIVSVGEDLVEEYFFVKRETLNAYIGTRSAATINLPLTEARQNYISRRRAKIDWREFCGEKGWDIVRNLIAQSRSG